MSTISSNWAAADFCLSWASNRNPDVERMALATYQCVCRTDFQFPGFCLVDLGTNTSSHELRRLMLELKGHLQQLHESRTGEDLVLLSAGRFDQQVTTKPHRDGGPDECFLMLGYEPSPVTSALALFDYSRCALDMGISPKELLDKHNPMFVAGEQLLLPYKTDVVCFSNLNYQIVLINNSMASYCARRPAWQGVLHTASIINPSDAHRRVVNSTMIASVAKGTPEPVSESQQREFLTTNIVHRRGYDRHHLTDT